MIQKFSKDVIFSRFHTFEQYMRDLIESSFGNCLTKLRLFVNFFETDDIFRYIAWVLKSECDVNILDWYADATRKGMEIQWPEASFRRLSLVYEIIFTLKQKRLDLRTFLVEHFPGGSIEAKFKSFKEDLLGLFQRDILLKIEEMREAMEDVEGNVDFETLSYAILMERQPVLAEEEEKPEKKTEKKAEKKAKKAAARPKKEKAPTRTKKGVTVKASPSPAVTALDQLAEAVKKARGLGDQKQDILVDIRILRIELGKKSPSIVRFREVLKPLTDVKGIKKRASALLEAIEALYG
jgi:hypothetical protein